MGSKTAENVAYALGAAFRIGDVVEAPVFDLTDLDRPILLLAPGQRIHTRTQVERLRAAGYRVLDHRRRTDGCELTARIENPVPLPNLSFAASLGMARRHRNRIQEATRALLDRVAADQVLELRSLLEASSLLASQVTANPYGLVALTSLHRCDDYTIEHSADVSILMVALAHQLGASEDELQEIAAAGLLHDVGKQRVPEAILNKPARLTDSEFEIIKKHPEWGHEYLLRIADCPECVINVTRRHHERLDGSGYPLGLRGDEIDPASRISSVADVFDALTANRVYRAGLPARDALHIIFTARGTHYDPEVVAALIKLIGVFPLGAKVLLSTGDHAEVVEPNPADPTRPVVEIFRDSMGRLYPTRTRLDLAEANIRIKGALRSECA